MEALVKQDFEDVVGGGVLSKTTWMSSGQRAPQGVRWREGGAGGGVGAPPLPRPLVPSSEIGSVSTAMISNPALEIQNPSEKNGFVSEATTAIATWILRKQSANTPRFYHGDHPAQPTCVSVRPAAPERTSHPCQPPGLHCPRLAWTGAVGATLLLHGLCQYSVVIDVYISAADAVSRKCRDDRLGRPKLPSG